MKAVRSTTVDVVGAYFMDVEVCLLVLPTEVKTSLAVSRAIPLLHDDTVVVVGLGALLKPPAFDDKVLRSGHVLDKESPGIYFEKSGISSRGSNVY
jgi:hypothetical protein